MMKLHVPTADAQFSLTGQHSLINSRDYLRLYVLGITRIRDKANGWRKGGGVWRSRLAHPLSHR
jgi:hypothetical protein